MRAHVEAPTYCSVVLASLLLKLGSYGCVRYRYALVNVMSTCEHIVVYALFRCLVSTLLCVLAMDVKYVVAISSVSHLCLLLVLVVVDGCCSVHISVVLAFVHACIRAMLFQLSGLVFRQHSRRCQYMYVYLLFSYSRVMF